MRGGRRRISVFAPASVANFGVGFDVLGAALDAPGVRVVSISGDGGRLPRNPRLNTAAVSAAAVLAELGGRRVGIELSLEKGLPLSSGLGSSAASAAAGAYAAGILLGERDRLKLLGAALEGERAADGSWHGDNVFAALLGGFVLVPSSDPGGTLAPVSLRVPSRVRIVVVIPGLELPTRRSRGVLPRTVSMGAHTAHAGALARLVLALSSGDLPAAGACLLADRLVDPKRLPLVRGGRAALDALLDAGAYGVCLAGAGPSLVGLTEESRDAERIGRAAVAAWKRSGVAARARVHRIDRRGTRLAGSPERAELGDDVEEAATGGAGRERSGERKARAAGEAPKRRKPAHARVPASLVPRRSMRCTRARAATPERFHAATAARPILSASLDSSVRPTREGPAPARQTPYAPASRSASSAARPPRTSGSRFGSTSRSARRHAPAAGRSPEESARTRRASAPACAVCAPIETVRGRTPRERRVGSSRLGITTTMRTRDGTRSETGARMPLGSEG